MAIYEEKCSGCRLCQLMCSLHHENVFDLTRSRIKVLEGEFWKYIPKVCEFCQDPPCAAACPTGALIPLAGGGVEAVAEKCIGCGKCGEVCEHHVIRFREVPPAPLICDLCGGKPVCVAICPMEAIVLEVDEGECVEGERCRMPARY